MEQTFLAAIVKMIEAGALAKIGENATDGIFSTAKKLLVKSKNKSHHDFSSEQGIDYSNLKRLLEQAYSTDNSYYWNKADLLTYQLMLRAVGRGESDWIRRNEMRYFPCSDLLIINSLWVTYSNGRFGLSVQNEIWKDLRDSQNICYFYGLEFMKRVGWLNAQGLLKERDDLNFSLNAPKGHLPYLLRTSGKLRKESTFWLFSFLSSRLDICSIS